MKRNNRLILIIIIPVFILLISLGFILPGNKITNTNNNSGFAVIELFTSEGCSSCPPADAVVARLSNEYKENVFVLGFHVDYWNNLGWKDEFSNAIYSKRQQQYAQQFHLSSVYTPQIIVNGKSELVGSDENQLCNKIANELKNAEVTSIELHAKINDAKAVQVQYKISNISSAILNIALVQLHAKTQVKRGENGGKILQHINIVREFKTITLDKQSSGNVTIQLPEGLTAKDCSIIAYLQNEKNLEITGATQSIIN